MSSCNVDVSAKKIDKQAVRQRAQYFIDKGFSKQETLEYLRQEFHHTKTAIKTLRCTLSAQQKQKYKLLNWTLLSILLVIFISTCLQASVQTPGTASIYAFFMYLVVKFRVRLYIWIYTFSGLFLIASVTIFLLSTEQWGLLSVLLVFFNIITLILSFYIEQKLCPKVVQEKEKYIDSNGQVKIRIIYTFTD